MEEQGLVVVNDNFLSKVTRFLKKFFSKKIDNIYLKDDERKYEIDIEYIKKDSEFVQKEIVEARSAFRKYIINNNKTISLDILNYIEEKLYENESKIKKIIEINHNDITFEDIQELLQKEKKNINNFKLRDSKTGCYQVPVGVIGVQCSNTKECVENMLKSITTRNSIMILDENYNKYSTESLILLIIKECLRNFYIDDDIIQMFEKEEIDLTKLDRVINSNNKSDSEIYSNIIYIYQEDDLYESDVIKEVNRLKNTDKYKDYEIKVVKGEFRYIIDFLNKNRAFAVCMYTNNSQKAYKFINWIDSPNLFVNTGVKNCRDIVNNCNEYFNFKYVLHEDVF